MTHLTHLVVALVYAAVALAVATTLPYAAPEVASGEALLWGGLVLVAAFSVHNAVARILRERDLARHIALDRAAMRHMEQQIVALGGRPQGEAGPDLTTVLAEVKLLKSLVGQLANGLTVPAPAPAAAEPEPLPSLRRTQAQRIAGDERAVLDVVREALQKDGVDIFLQPIVSLPQRKVRFYEVMSRVRAPDGSHLLPEQYMPIAAKAGLGAAIDDLLLFRSVRLVQETERRQHSIGFFVNVSSATLSDTRFMNEFADYLAENGSLGSKLTFEVAQRDVLSGLLDTESARRLSRLGCRFSMNKVDSFNIDPAKLYKLDVRYVKLDSTVLMAIARRSNGRDNIMQFKKLVESQPIDIVVERIETEPQLIELLDLSIDYGQGALFGEPRLSKAANPGNPTT